MNGTALTPVTPNAQSLSVKARINTSGIQTVVASIDNGYGYLRDTLTFFVAAAAPEAFLVALLAGEFVVDVGTAVPATSLLPLDMVMLMLF